jgi:hypothetical protein
MFRKTSGPFVYLLLEIYCRKKELKNLPIELLPTHLMKAQGGVREELHPFLTSALD